MAQLAPLDLGLILAYFILLLGVGWWYGRKQTEEDFLIAERNLSTFSTMMTVNASKTGAIPMIFTALVFVWGFSAIWFFIGMVIGVLIFIPFAVRLKKKSQHYYTLADYFKTAHGKKAGMLASLITILIMLFLLINNLIGGTKVFSFFTGWPFWVCALVMIVVVLAYLLLAGFKAVAKTDVLQYAAMVITLVVLGLFLFKGFSVPATAWNLFSAGPGTIIGFLIAGVFFPFASPELWQRVYSARDEKAVSKGLLWSVCIYACFALLLAFLALFVKVTFPQIDPDLALIYGFSQLLPPGLLGLGVVLLFAALMSSIDTYLFTAVSSAVQDFTQRKYWVKYMKRGILALGIVGTLFTILFQDLLISSYIMVAFMTLLGTCTIASWIKPNIQKRTIVTGLVVGGIILLIIIPLQLMITGITPLIVLGTLVATLLGLLIGSLSTFKTRTL